MADIEKAIHGLELVKEDICERFTSGSQISIDCLRIDKALALLKEQEEPKQIVRKQCKTEHSDGSIDYYAEWFCPHCSSLLKRGFDAPWIEYCFKCGKPITWEGR